MNRRAFLASAAAMGGGSALTGRAFGQQAGIDYASIDKLRQAGLGRTSEVMATASYLTDVLGPRLTGSPGAEKSGQWTVSKMKEWGLVNAGLEAWPSDPTGTNNGFPRGWTNTHFYMAALAPAPFPIVGMSTAWTAGTNGLVSGECVLASETKEDELKAKYAGKLRGKWVLASEPRDIRAPWEPTAQRLTRDQLAAMETPNRGPEFGTPPPPQPPRPQPPRPGDLPPYDRSIFFHDEGALGLLTTNRSQGVFTVQGAVRTRAPEEIVPQIVIVAEHYNRIARSLKSGVAVTLEADIRNDWRPNPPMFNLVGEIRGSEKPQEIVMIGGHFDSWHAATGATDNACSCAAALEAMRLLKTTGAPLRRTVRICLWTGEEEGLIGSRLYVASHFGGVRGAPTKEAARGVIQPFTKDHDKVQGYFNLDNGGGLIRGLYAQSNMAMVPIFRQWMEPFRDLGMTTIDPRNTGSTDHISFDAAGLPGFEFIQDPINYETETHHTNLDDYDSLQPEDMRRNATILASFAMLAANHPTQLPRKSYVPEPTPEQQRGRSL